MEEILLNYKDNFSNFNEIEKNKYIITCKAKEKKSEKPVFLKVYDKREINKGPVNIILNQINREEELTNFCKCENVVELYEKLETDISVIFVYERCYYNLQEYMKQKSNLMNKTKFFIKIVRSIAKALKTLNDKKIIHRDIKPYNIYLKKIDLKKTNIEENCIIKLGDFGCAIKKEENDFIQIGTPFYVAPEIMKKEYDEKCDMWSVGITLYYIYFGFTPYGNDYDVDSFMDKIYSNNFIFKFSNIPILDILFKKLLTFETKDRMTHEEFYEYVFNKEFENAFSKENKTEIINEIIIKYEKEYKEIQRIMNSEEYKEMIIYIEEIKKEGKDKEKEKVNNMKKLVRIVSMSHSIDFVYFENKDNEEEKIKVYNNILYYNKGLDTDKIKEEVNKFENSTLGTFFFCKNNDSFELILKEINDEVKYNDKFTFNLIVTDSEYKENIKLIEENYKGCFKYICIYCEDIKNCIDLKEENKKIVLISNDKDIIVKEFINKYSDLKTFPFPAAKLVTYDQYIDKYFFKHEIVSDFYGDLTKTTYLDNQKKLKNLIGNDNLKKFETFNLTKDLNNINEKLINDYTKNTFFGDLNRHLRTINMDSFEEVAYFASRFMYSLNDYAIDNNKFYNEENKLYRGMSIKYSDLIAYERVKNKIIIFSSFTSMSESEDVVKRTFAYKRKYYFSVIFYIKNLHKDKWISSGINIQQISNKKYEKEIIFQPFSFYRVIDVEINIKNYEAKIYLETIGKKEILEEEIKDHNHIIKYIENDNIVKAFKK